MDKAHNQTDTATGTSGAVVLSSDQQLAALKARCIAADVYLANAEKQLIEAQSLISLVLSEAEDKLRWAASIDRALQTMHGVLADRDALIQRQEVLLAEYETKVADFDNAHRDMEAESQANALKVERMQKTFSWKATAPFRFLRRTFIDKQSNG